MKVEVLKMALIQVRIDDETKREADDLFAQIGLYTPTAIRIFIHQSLNHYSLPFEIKLPYPNKETLEALKEAREIANNPNVKSYENVDEMFNDMEKEENVKNELTQKLEKKKHPDLTEFLTTISKNQKIYFDNFL